MNLSKYKMWRLLLQRVIAKQQAKREQSHPVCWHAVEKYENMENVNTQYDYKATRKKWADKKKTDLPVVFFKCLNSMKTSSRSFKIISGK